MLLSLFQVFWLCIICKKKQELLAKTGSWFHSRNTKDIDTIREIETELSTPPSHSPINAESAFGLKKSGKSSLNPIFTGRKVPEQYGASLPKPAQSHSGGSSPEITKPILVRTKSLDTNDTNSWKRENKENLSDNSDSSVYLSDIQSKKKTVTFGKNDVIQTHVEYIEDMDRIQGISNEIQQMNQDTIAEVNSFTSLSDIFFKLPLIDFSTSSFMNKILSSNSDDTQQIQR